jgi:hypothetical protein
MDRGVGRKKSRGRYKSHYSGASAMRSEIAKLLKRVARPRGVEPPTFWFVARRSIQLSYGRAAMRLLR